MPPNHTAPPSSSNSRVQQQQRASAIEMAGFMFNIDGGYLEGLCRGFKCGILKQSDYLNLVQCETLEGEPIIAISVEHTPFKLSYI